MTRLRPLALSAVLLVETDPAFAHTVVEGVGGFYGGLLHPVLVPAHALALVGLGLLAGQQEPRHRAAVLMIFAAGLLAAVIAIVAAVAAAAAAKVVLATAGVAGILVALAQPVPKLLTGLLAAMAGAALELDSVPQEISMQTTLIALAGTAIGAHLVLLLVAEVAAGRRRPWQRIGMRILGSWIGASAALVLALELAR